MCIGSIILIRMRLVHLSGGLQPYGTLAGTSSNANPEPDDAKPRGCRQADTPKSDQGDCESSSADDVLQVCGECVVQAL